MNDSLRIDLVYTDADGREFHAGRTIDSEDAGDRAETLDAIDLELEGIRDLVETDRRRREDGGEVVLTPLSPAERREAAELLRQFADIDDGEYLSTESVRELADVIHPPIA